MKKFFTTALLLLAVVALATPNARQIAEKQMKERPLPAVTADIYWPEETGKDVIKVTLEDPELVAKMKEIDRLRGKALAIVNAFPQQKIAVNVPKNADDGHYLGFSPEDGKARSKLQKTKIEAADYLRTAHEKVIQGIIPILDQEIIQWQKHPETRSPEKLNSIQSALLYYMDFELYRKSYRWVATTFLMPQLACRAYFTFLEQMNAVENGMEKAPEWIRINQLCKAVAVQCFTEQKENRPGKVLTVDCFRKHGHWVGGNFGYRPTILTGLLCRNPRMLDVAIEVISRSFSVTSYNTNEESFWTEGITADGAGWGHGKQNYIFGYPGDNLNHIGKNLRGLRGSLWLNKIDPLGYEYVVYFIESALWFNYGSVCNGVTLMCPGRRAFEYHGDANVNDLARIAAIGSSFRAFIPRELKDLHLRLNNALAIYKGQKPQPVGSRYFWNNDDLIVRSEKFWIGVNMTSKRSNSCEVSKKATSHTDLLNDGSTYLMRRPTTYAFAKGFWNECGIPGITARQSKYETNRVWIDNYIGKHNFAGGVAENGFGACGFIYEKLVNDWVKVPMLYNLMAHKSYFIFDGVAVMLGAGITDLDPKLKLPTHTTLDQTEFLSELSYSNKNGKVSTAEPKATVQAQATKAWQAGVGYASLDGKPFIVKADVRDERWVEFDCRNAKAKDRPKTYPVLELYFDHGVAPKNDSYAYLADLKSNSFEEFSQIVASNNLRVLANSVKLQAVSNAAAKTAQAVWFDAIEPLKWNGRSIKVSAPLVAQFRETAEGLVVTVNDPCQNPDLAEVTITASSPINGKKELKITLPQGVQCGRPVTVKW